MIYTANSVLQIALHSTEIILNTNQKLCQNLTSLLRPKSQKNILKFTSLHTIRYVFLK